MNKLILENLFAPPDLKIYGTIVKPLGGTRYQVRDLQGRLMTVDASTRWANNSGVTVKDGRIVGKASKFVPQEVFQV